MNKRQAGFALALALLLLSSCAATFRNHGFTPRAEQLARVTVGSDTRESVIEKIGGPGLAGLTTDDAWYYVESRFRHAPFRAPEEVRREVLKITFNAAGRVANIERFGLQDGRIIRLSARVTPGVDDDGGILAAIFRNVGQGNTGGLLN